MDKEAASTNVVLHVDLDCFYAAVEHSRLNIPVEKPLAVQQWEGLIAVNYAARAAGIVRHDRVSDALRKCPDLQLVHVETIGNDKGDGAASRCEASKVSLERYRQASKCVFDIFHRHSDICERASIDEAYLDVTKKVETFMKEGCNWSEELHRLLGEANGKVNMVVESASCDVWNPVSRRLLAGAIIAEQIRADVRSKLGYTCSVGIAMNKLLAKIASARNKPDRQTLVLPEAVADLMDALPLKKVKLLGGKIGEELSEKWRCQTAGDAQKVPLRSLLASFGDRLGNYVYNAIRGIHEDRVQEKQTTKSMLAAKSFQATKDVTVIRMWLGVLAEELSIRMLRDAKENHRQPHNLQLYYRSGISRQSGDRSKSCSMPHTIIQLLASACLGDRVLVLEHQHNDCRAPSRNCDSDNNLESEVKVREMHESNDLISGCNHHMVDEAAGNLLPDKTDSGIHNSTRTTPTPSYVTNAEDNDGTENEETAKQLSKLLQEASFQLFQRLEDAFPCTRLAIAASGFHNAPAQGSQSIEHFFGYSCHEPAMPSIDSSTGLLGGTKLVNKHKGLLKYFDDGTSKNLCVPLSEPEATEQSVEEEALENRNRQTCESSVLQNANLPAEKAGYESTLKPPLNLPDSFGLLAGQMNRQGNSTPPNVDLKDIDVNEQWRILKEIQKARAPAEAGDIPLNANPEKQALKRRKSKASDAKSGQQFLSKFFQS